MSNLTLQGMFNAVVSEDPEVIPYTIYQHFKGGYYLVLAVAYKEGERDQEKKEVVYQSLKDGVVWTRDLEVFTSDIPKERSLTGQTKRFVRVDHFENQLSCVPTDTLVEELRRRQDNPYVGYDPETAEKAFITEYMCGFREDKLNAQGNTDTVFHNISVHTSLDDAKAYAAGKTYKGNPVEIMHHMVIPVTD